MKSDNVWFHIFYIVVILAASISAENASRFSIAAACDAEGIFFGAGAVYRCEKADVKDFKK